MGGICLLFLGGCSGWMRINDFCTQTVPIFVLPSDANKISKSLLKSIEEYNKRWYIRCRPSF